MADNSCKAAHNVAGRYYVDTSCISCSQCADVAGDFFAEDADGGFCVVKQPHTQDEVALCEKALEGCPVSAIGNDG